MNDQELLEWMNRRQRQIMVHSFLYYQMDENIIDDHVYDLWTKELAEAILKYPLIFKKTAYYEGFIGFDGSTGMDLPYSSPEIQRAGFRLLDYKHHRRNL